MGYHWDFGHIVVIQLGYSVRNHVRWNIIGNIMVHDLQICAALRFQGVQGQTTHVDQSPSVAYANHFWKVIGRA